MDINCYDCKNDKMMDKVLNVWKVEKGWKFGFEKNIQIVYKEKGKKKKKLDKV